MRIQDLPKGGDHGERAERETIRRSEAEPSTGSRGKAPGAKPLVRVRRLKMKAFLFIFIQKIAKSQGFK